jgi:hypothetical protein
MILMNVNLSKYYGSGPAYPANGLEPVDCKTTWKVNSIKIIKLLKD